ncbi:family 43 glycosylhydrolase [Adhaeribacter radiodurans]|uniref:Family 43 glycosylhydrolase n=1 Tax=Adhaeribacter radiodurans TaxID=2745197 RepID=A0A7L7L1W9_9BACT|nr:family 43 glycosylhydrolase [Adhaeribacter radiodurans]QMU26763.1 family 43 glycosylhydrolase [Adhaeribacter radiodurans]
MQHSLFTKSLFLLAAFIFCFLINSEVVWAQAGTAINSNPKVTYQNPVFNHDFPDPNLVQGTDGYYYAYSTQADWRKDNFGGPYVIPILRSKDLVNWEVVGPALAQKPDWKEQGGIWAPDAVYYKGKYYLYYSFSTWGDPNPGIGVAVADKPEGPFTDHGKLFLSKEVGVDNSIDAFFFEDKGTPYLIWGSFHGIYGIQLSGDGTQIKGEKFQMAGTDYEGSLIYKKGKFYYYLGSTGTCCEGEKSTYEVKVGRAKKFKGPYLDKNGKPLLENGGTRLLQKNVGTSGFVGPGHNGDIIQDKAGQTWMLYHGFRKDSPKTGRVMLLDKIKWQRKWPVMETGQPTITPQAAPVF